MRPKATIVERSCAQCGKPFLTTEQRVADGHGRHCSRPCLYASLRARIERICEQCGATFHTKPSQIAQGKGRLCSKTCANAALLTDPVARFWSYVNKTETCWTWTGATDKDGYGVFWADGKSIRAHVYSWTLHFGPTPEDHGVLHRCDNPPCVKPDDLFTGTTAINMADKVAKGRQVVGERHAHAKLTDALVNALLTDRANGMTLKALGAKYGIHFGTVHDICTGVTWRHVPRPR